MSIGNGTVEAAKTLRIDLEKKVLWRNGEPVHMPGKAVELLCTLVEGRGEVITKAELLDRVWADSFVEESVLSQNIYVLRKLFRESGFPADPIETVPRRGYRFRGDIRTTSETGLIVEREIVERELMPKSAKIHFATWAPRKLNVRRISRSAVQH